MYEVTRVRRTYCDSEFFVTKINNIPKKNPKIVDQISAES